MTDHDLLKLAALAAGYDIKWDPTWLLGAGSFMRRAIPQPPHPFSEWLKWSPLEDDEDALRLAIHCALSIFTSARTASGGACVAVSDCCGVRLVEEDAHNAEEDAHNAYAVTRRAIVRAAAEIGRRISKEEVRDDH